MADGFTAKQQAFIDEYPADLNGAQAAIRAGYSPKTARTIAAKLLTKVDIAQAIADALDARSQRTEITQDIVLEGLRTEATRTGKGSSPSARVAAWGLLAKHLGMFIERVHHSGDVTTAVREMSDAELMARASQFTNRLTAPTNGNGAHPN